MCDDCVTDAAATPGLPGSLPLPRMCYWCWDGVMWGVCTMGWTTWRLRDCWCCLTGAAWMVLLWQWFFCCLLSKLHGDRVTDAAATTPGSTEWTAGTTAWQLRDCWCCLTWADYNSLDCVHGISCKFIMTGVPCHWGLKNSWNSHRSFEPIMQWGTGQPQSIFWPTNHKRVMPANLRPWLIPGSNTPLTVLLPPG